MLKKILIGLGVLVGILGISFFIFYYSGPTFPPNTNEIIKEVIATDIPDLTTGKADTAMSGDVSIWYEVYGDSAKPVILLIMGHSATSLLWPEFFVNPLINAGYRVVKMDNRGCGMSDWIENWDEQNPYNLMDMAGDAIAVLDDMQVEKAHIVGFSMGGGIAQIIARQYKDRVLSMTSISSSSSFDNDPSLGFVADYMRVRWKYPGYEDMHTLLKRAVGYNLAMSGSTERTDAKLVAERTWVDIKGRKGINPTMSKQHSAAVATSANLIHTLPEVEVPVLVVHGIDDPLVLLEAGEASATLIPHAKTLWVKNMGHNLPKHAVPEIHEALLALMKE